VNAKGEILNGPQNPARHSRVLIVVAMLVVLALGGTLFLYREALQLPFFFDDMIHLRWLDWHSLSLIWTTAEGLGYYRPLTMSVWKIGYLLLGYNDPGKLHFLNLLLHALNTTLVGYIAWRTWRGAGQVLLALIAASLFLTYPFNYQAIPSTSSLSKPLIATLVLGSVALYWESRRRCSRGLMALSLALGFLAPFAYETGVTVPLAILAVEILEYTRQEFERFSRLSILYMILIWGIGLPLIVLMEPNTGASLHLPSLLNLWQNGVYFSQGLLFPLSPLATPLAQILPIDQYVLLAIVNLVGFVAVLAFYRWAGRLDVFWYALSWFVVGILPLWLMLDFSYVITSPRLLYLGGAGAALVWGGIPVLLYTKLPSRSWLKALAVAGLLGMLVFNVAYIRDKMALAGVIARPIWQAAQAAAVHGKSASLLYLNVPAWIAPKKPIYRVGTEGLTFIPQYVRVQDSVYVNASVEPRIRAFMFDSVKQEWDAYIGYAGAGLDVAALAKEIRRADAVYLTTYASDGLRFVEAGAVEGSEPVTLNTAGARFGEQILLVKHQAELSESELLLKLWWQAGQVPQGNVTVFAHIYDQAGQLLTQGDGFPLAGLFPPGEWQPGERVRDVRVIAFPDDMADGTYTVAVGWYNADTDQRLSVRDQEGQPVENDALCVFEFAYP
jgi:hypothetical protein